MSQPAFLDANIPLYSSGRPHPLREPARRIIRLVAQQSHAFVTDAEIFQELLHRYLSLHTWAEGQRVFDEFLALMDGRVESVHADDVAAAAALAGSHPGMTSRDYLHVAVMQRLGISRIVTADRGFGRFPGIERLDPADVDEWRSAVVEDA
jgi:uncharacterized protein